MNNFRFEQSQRTYNSSKNIILADPNDPWGKAMVEQLINETSRARFQILGALLLLLQRLLVRRPDQLNQARKILKYQ